MHGKTVLIVAVAIIAGTACGQVYRHWKAGQDAAFTAGLVEATGKLEQNNAPQAVALLTPLAEHAKGEHKAMALLWLARAQFAADDSKAAQKTLTQIIASQDEKSIWKQTACIWQAGASGTWPQDCTHADSSPLHSSALELAMADAIQRQDWKNARSLYTQLRTLSADLPEQRSRVLQLGLLIPEEMQRSDAGTAAHTEK
jgi:hypothetical protein